MVAETVRLVSQTPTSSQVQTNIETLFAALDSLEKGREERGNKYQIDSREKLDLAARELRANAEAGRVVQKQRDLESLKNQLEADTAAFDYMTNKINERLEELSDSNPEEMIEVLERKLEHLKKLIDEADVTEKNLDKDLRALQRRKAALERRLQRKGAQRPGAARE